jgi:hypothetical protein
VGQTGEVKAADARRVGNVITIPLLDTVWLLNSTAKRACARALPAEVPGLGVTTANRNTNERREECGMD